MCEPLGLSSNPIGKSYLQLLYYRSKTHHRLKEGESYISKLVVYEGYVEHCVA